MTLFLIALTFTVSLVQGDLTVYCEDSLVEGKVTYGGLQEFEACTNCQCYVFELLCLEQEQDSDTFYLYSRSLTYAKQCVKCVCNNNPILWSAQ